MSDLREQVRNALAGVDAARDEAEKAIANAIQQEMVKFHERTGLHVHDINVSVLCQMYQGKTDSTVLADVTLQHTMNVGR